MTDILIRYYRTALLGFLLLFLLIFFLLGPTSLFATEGINAQIPFQGVLNDSVGSAQDGNFDIVFNIYDADTGGSVLWTGTYTAANGNAVAVTDGVFRVMLGSGTGNTLDLDFNDDSYYLGITIESDAEMTPRERLGATGYAINADMLDGLHASSFLLGDSELSISTSSANSLLIINQAGSGDVFNALSSSTEVFTILQNGNVGISSSTPESKLSVYGDIASTFFSTTDSAATSTIAGSLEILGNTVFSGSIQTADGIGIQLGDEDHGLTIIQDTNTFGQNDILIGMRGDATLNNYVNIAASSTLSFTANAAENGWGTYHPSLSLNNSGTVRLDNTSQGDVSSRYFDINMDSGVRITNGGLLVTTGGIGIATSSSGNGLDVAGVINSTVLLGGSVNLTTDMQGNIIRDPSDSRLKENIQPIEDALETTLKLNGVTYQWIDKSRFGDQTEIGFIAQDLQQVLPEVVSAGGEYLSVNTRNILGVVVEAVKEMYFEVQEYFARTENLEMEVARLKVEISQLKAQHSLPIQNNDPIAPPSSDSSIDDIGTTTTETDVSTSTSTTTEEIIEPSSEDSDTSSTTVDVADPEEIIEDIIEDTAPEDIVEEVVVIDDAEAGITDPQVSE